MSFECRDPDDLINTPYLIMRIYIDLLVAGAVCWISHIGGPTVKMIPIFINTPNIYYIKK